MKRIACALMFSALLAGCSTMESSIRDGKEYVGEYPVLHAGILLDIQIPDQENNVHSVAKEAANTLETGTGSAAALASMATGIGAAGGGVIVGILGTLLDAYASTNPPPLPKLVIEQTNGEMLTLLIEPQNLKHAIDFHCIAIGDPIKVFHDGYRPVYINGDTRLSRKVIVEPSCESLREKYGVASIKTNP